MTQAEGLILRQTQRAAYAARVRVQVQRDPEGPQILMDCVGSGFSSQGYIEEATASGYQDWKQGAEAGARYALLLVNQEQTSVRIIQILGLTTDTNPTIVGVAAMKAVWQALGFVPQAAEVERWDQIVLASWKHPYDFVPDFGIETGVVPSA